MENKKIMYENPIEAGISKEKIELIVEKLEEVMALINSIEYHLIGTKYEHSNLLNPNIEEPTLWTQFYTLKKLFENKT